LNVTFCVVLDNLLRDITWLKDFERLGRRIKKEENMCTLSTTQAGKGCTETSSSCAFRVLNDSKAAVLVGASLETRRIVAHRTCLGNILLQLARPNIKTNSHLLRSHACHHHLRLHLAISISPSPLHHLHFTISTSPSPPRHHHTFDLLSIHLYTLCEGLVHQHQPSSCSARPSSSSSWLLHYSSWDKS
jgi:hypothetical protein